ncbi:hypothetical protein GN956_G5854 [Arapaima gigas]
MPVQKGQGQEEEDKVTAGSGECDVELPLVFQAARQGDRQDCREDAAGPPREHGGGPPPASSPSEMEKYPELRLLAKEGRGQKYLKLGSSFDSVAKEEEEEEEEEEECNSGWTQERTSPSASEE